MIGDFFDKVYVITCNSSTDRQKYISEHFYDQKIPFEFMSAIDKQYLLPKEGISGSEVSLKLTYTQCIQTAKLNNYEKILICEDDVAFPKDYNKNFDSFLKLLPTDWDFLHLGSQPCALSNWVIRNKISENLYKFVWGMGAHCVGIKNTSYDAVINNLLNTKDPLDTALFVMYEKFNAYCPEEWIDALSEVTHLRHLLDTKDILKKKFVSTIDHTGWDDFIW